MGFVSYIILLIFPKVDELKYFTGNMRKVRFDKVHNKPSKVLYLMESSTVHPEFNLDLPITFIKTKIIQSDAY